MTRWCQTIVRYTRQQQEWCVDDTGMQVLQQRKVLMLLAIAVAFAGCGKIHLHDSPDEGCALPMLIMDKMQNSLQSASWMLKYTRLPPQQVCDYVNVCS